MKFFLRVCELNAMNDAAFDRVPEGVVECKFTLPMQLSARKIMQQDQRSEQSGSETTEGKIKDGGTRRAQERCLHKSWRSTLPRNARAAVASRPAKLLAWKRAIFAGPR